MVKTFEGIDNEFAVATGANVDNGADRSTFDYPPDDSFDLRITSKTGDSDPNRFDLGDTYAVSWGGSGGGGLIDTATVVRSDDGPDGTGGVIVFEGLDENGDMAQVVWSPDVNLDGWYWDNYSQDQLPGFHTTDQNPAYTHSYVCFAADTPIATPHGPCPAGDLGLGDLVCTHDDGPQPVLWVGQRQVCGIGENAPVHFAPDSIGNRQPLRLSQHHRIMVTSPMAELMFGHHEVFVPAKAMLGHPGISLRACAKITYVHFLLPCHSVISAAEGAPCESLFPGGMTEHLLYDHWPTLAHLWGNRAYRAARPILTYREARCLIGNARKRHATVLI